MGKLWTDEETTPFMTPWRRAEVIPDKGRKKGIIDGDSFRVRVDLGFERDPVIYCRLLSEGAVLTLDDESDDKVDAWETRGKERELGLKALDRAKELLGGPGEKELRIWSFKGEGDTGKYGRWLLVILYPVEGGWRSLGDTLLEEGHAERPDY